MILCQFLTLSALLVLVSAGIGPFDLSQDSKHSPPPQAEEGLIQGDFKLSERQKLNLKLYGNIYGPASRGASGRDKERWPGAIIPYVFDCSVLNRPGTIQSVKEAMATWESKTCIRFVERTTEDNYLEFFRSSGCWASYVGYQNSKTQISVGEGCDYKHVMEHEIGHVVGFWHEQMRQDRDSYIEILWDNVADSMKYNFDKVPNGAVNSLGEEYDYSSIMHYPWNAFAKDYSKNTIRPIRPLNGKEPYIGLSDGDASQANRMYKCNDVVRQRRAAELEKAKRAVQDDSSLCEDKYELCPTWVAAGYCVESPNPALKVCRKSCGNCEACQDEYDTDYCKAMTTTSQGNYCDKRPDVMWRKCKVTCDVCKPDVPTTQPPQTTRPPQPTNPTTKPPQPTNPTTKPPQPTNPATRPPTPTVNPDRPKYRGLRCADADTRCPEWANNGGCTSHPWTKRHCQLSCKRTDLCDMEQPKLSGSCSEPLGLGWDRTLPDSAFEASTEFFPGGGWGATADNARLYMRDDHDAKRIGAWCSQYGHYDNQWLKIDLGQVKMVSAVATQGRDRYFEHVKTYELSFSEYGSNWQKYKENNTVKIFEGNCDNITPVINKLSAPIRARFVKFHPRTFHAGICIRAEVYGCNV